MIDFISGPGTHKACCWEFVFGLVVAIAMVAIYHTWLKSADFFIAGTNPMKEKISGIGLGQPWKFVALGVFYSLCHSFLEEYYWRWFVFGQLKRLTRFWPAVIVSSLGFMAHHVLVVGTYFGYQSPITWLFSLAIAIGGGFWAWLYDRSGLAFRPLGGTFAGGRGHHRGGIRYREQNAWRLNCPEGPNRQFAGM